MKKNVIDNKKIFNLALKQESTDIYFKNFNNMLIEEFVMFIGFVYAIKMNKAGFLSKSARNRLCRIISTQCELIAKDLCSNREISKAQTKYIKESEILRVDLTKAIKSFDDETALQIAVKLVDFSTFGAAAGGLGTYSQMLKNREQKQTEDKPDHSDYSEFSKNCKEIIDYLNKTTGSNYKCSSKATQRLIKARLNEGFTVADFKTVIKKMQLVWGGGEMSQYLRPQTLFSNKFESYLNAQFHHTMQKLKGEPSFDIDEIERVSKMEPIEQRRYKIKNAISMFKEKTPKEIVKEYTEGSLLSDDEIKQLYQEFVK